MYTARNIRSLDFCNFMQKTGIYATILAIKMIGANDESDYYGCWKR